MTPKLEDVEIMSTAKNEAAVPRLTRMWHKIYFSQVGGISSEQRIGRWRCHFNESV